MVSAFDLCQVVNAESTLSCIVKSWNIYREADRSLQGFKCGYLIVLG